MLLSLPSPILILSSNKPDSGMSKVSICQVKQMLQLMQREHLGGKTGGNTKLKTHGEIDTSRLMPLIDDLLFIYSLLDISHVLHTVRTTNKATNKTYILCKEFISSN